MKKTGSPPQGTINPLGGVFTTDRQFNVSSDRPAQACCYVSAPTSGVCRNSLGGGTARIDLYFALGGGGIAPSFNINMSKVVFFSFGGGHGPMASPSIRHCARG